MKALTVEMETVTLIGRGRQNLTHFVYSLYTVSSKIFFLADISFLGGHFRFGQIHFPLAYMLICGGHLLLESSCIQVNTVLLLFSVKRRGT
jgi:hypothetical protein